MHPGQRRRLLFGAQENHFLLLVAAHLLYGAGEQQPEQLRLNVPGVLLGLFRHLCGRQRNRLSEAAQPVRGNAAPGLLQDRLGQSNLPGAAPLELRPHRPGGGHKDQSSVPLAACRANQPLPGFHRLAGLGQHRAADKVGAHHHAAALRPDAVQRSGGNVGLGLCGSGFHFQPSFGKIQAGP